MLPREAPLLSAWRQEIAALRLDVNTAAGSTPLHARYVTLRVATSVRADREAKRAKAAASRSEKPNLAKEQPDLIRQAKEILKRETPENAVFPLAIPD